MFSVSAMAAQTKQPNGGYLPVSLYKSKRVNSSYGSMDIDVPQDRKSTFEPQIVKKRQKDISDIDQKIISMYAKGMTTWQISETIEDIYGFETSEGFISDVTVYHKWQEKQLSISLCEMFMENSFDKSCFPN